jgi:hypothetical protein
VRLSNRDRFGEALGLLARIVNPGVPWWVALPCNLLAGIALILLALNPGENLPVALALLVPATVVLYGTALLIHWRKSRRP